MEESKRFRLTPGKSTGARPVLFTVVPLWNSCFQIKFYDVELSVDFKVGRVMEVVYCLIRIKFYFNADNLAYSMCTLSDKEGGCFPCLIKSLFIARLHLHEKISINKRYGSSAGIIEYFIYGATFTDLIYGDDF